MGDNKDNVRVAIRIRPLNDKERQDSGKTSIFIQDPGKTLAIDVRSEKKNFTFDYIASEDITQEEVFEKIGKPIAASCLSGYNGTIFTYGQTGAGKTFTILGHQLENIATISPEYTNRGLLPRCFEYLFNAIQEEISQSDTKYLIKCSYLEIYQEQVNDLLDPNPQNLQLREDMRHGVYVDGLIEETVNNISETYNILKIGTQNRHVGCTSMNKESSRSHSVFTLVIESKESNDGITNFRTSRFHLIDLAGSERQRATDCAGERLKEAGMINKSLSALGNVINSLVDISDGKSRHVHYRDSKLTFLLKDSLGGNSKTYIVANISPSVTVIGETLSTLKFAQRAKQIKNIAVVNEDTSGALSMLRHEVIRLKEELSIAKEQTTCNKCCRMLTVSNEDSNFAEILEKTLRLKQEDTGAYMRQISDKENYILGLKSTVAKLENKISHDKMILKFRDATISSLQGNTVDESKEIQDLKKEIELLKEQNESNPQAAKLFVENERLLNEIHQQKLEIKGDIGSVHQRNLELEEINCKMAENLKYLLQEKEEIAEKLTNMTEKYKSLKDTKWDLETTVEKLREKVSDLEILNLTLQTENNIANEESNLKDSRGSMDDLLLNDKEIFQDDKIDQILFNVAEQQTSLQNEFLNKIKYQEIIKELQEKNNKLEEKIKNYENEVGENLTGDEYGMQVAKMAEDINYLEIQYQNKENEAEINKNLIKEFQDKNLELEKNLQENQYILNITSERINLIEKELLDSKEANKKQESIIKEFQGNIENTNKLREELIKQIETNEFLSVEYGKINTVYEQIKEKSKISQEEVNNLHTKVKELTSEIKEHRDNQSSCSDKADYYREEYLKTSQELDDAKQENEELLTRLKLEKEKTEFLEETLENLKLEYAKSKLDYERKYNEASQEIKHLEIE